MRIKLAFILASFLLLANCGPNGQHKENTGLSGTTGFADELEQDYVSNGDTRVEEALRLPEPVTANTTQKPTIALTKQLREKLKEFEISRFNAGDKEPSRFGDSKLTLKVIFKGEGSVVFQTQLLGAKPKFQINASSGKYKLSGELVDREQQTKGDLTLTNTVTQQSARILYWAYKGKLKVREDRTKKIVPGSALEQQIKALRENTFGWVNNWNVVRGPSFYLIDIVKVIRGNMLPDDLNSVMSLKGPSLRTGRKTYNAETLGKNAPSAKLVGNGEDVAGRMFEITVQNPDTKETNEFMLDVEPDVEVSSPGEKPAPEEQEFAPEEPDQIVPDQPAVSAQPDVTQKPEKPANPDKPKEEPVRNGKSFLRVDTSLPRTAKMTADFNRNRNLTGVKTWMQTYQHGYRRGLENFYDKAAPFRRILEAVGQTFDVSPVYAYVTVIESYYFTKGRYEIEGADGSSALGPFQLLTGTAREMGLNVGGSTDERRYFVPSSCGAAKYFRKLVNTFGSSDSTVSILGYFQGDGGAAAAIYCSFDENAGDREACAKRINKSKDRGGFTGSDYGRFLKLVKRYDYSFAEMDKMAAIPKPMRNYVNQKLAIYFISNDMGKYGFEAGPTTSLPGNGTVMPRRPLKDSACQNAVADVLTGS